MVNHRTRSEEARDGVDQRSARGRDDGAVIVGTGPQERQNERCRPKRTNGTSSSRVRFQGSSEDAFFRADRQANVAGPNPGEAGDVGGEEQGRSGGRGLRRNRAGDGGVTLTNIIGHMQDGAADVRDYSRCRDRRVGANVLRDDPRLDGRQTNGIGNRHVRRSAVRERVRSRN